MKFTVVYRIQNLVNGKVFIGKHSTNDLFFANPMCRLSELTLTGTPVVAIGDEDGPKTHVSLVSTDTLPAFSTKKLIDDIKQYGKNNFTVEALYAGLKDTVLDNVIERQYNQYLEIYLANPMKSYNATGQQLAQALIASSGVKKGELNIIAAGMNVGKSVFPVSANNVVYATGCESADAALVVSLGSPGPSSKSLEPAHQTLSQSAHPRSTDTSLNAAETAIDAIPPKTVKAGRGQWKRNKK
jgi:hypothetical protein